MTGAGTDSKRGPILNVEGDLVALGPLKCDEIYMDCLSTEFERPATSVKGRGFYTWLPPGGETA